MKQQTIDKMTGREVAEFLTKFMERGEQIMCADRPIEFEKGFKIAIAGMAAGLQILDGENKDIAAVGAVAKIAHLYV